MQQAMAHAQQHQQQSQQIRPAAVRENHAGLPVLLQLKLVICVLGWRLAAVAAAAEWKGCHQALRPPHCMVCCWRLLALLLLLLQLDVLCTLLHDVPFARHPAEQTWPSARQTSTEGRNMQQQQQQ
jgi:hypothetical protein